MSPRQLTEAQLKAGARAMAYRTQQLARVGALVAKRGELRGPQGAVQVMRNALVESALINARSVSEFLRRRSRRNSLHASLFISEWSHRIGDLAESAWGPLSEYVAHPTIRRPGNLLHPGEWPIPELANALGGAIADFVDEWAGRCPQSAEWFSPDPRVEVAALGQIAYDATVLSENPQVAALTRAVQDYMRETSTSS